MASVDRDWSLPELRDVGAGIIPAHTMPSVTRLWPIYCLLVQANPKVVWTWTVAPDRYNDSVYSDPVHRFLSDRGAVIEAWNDVVKGGQDRYKIALAAARDGLEQLRIPVALMAHGSLRDKVTPPADGAGIEMPRTQYGTGLDYWVHQGRTIARYALLAHRDQVGSLDPSLRSIARVIGDPMVDQIDGHMALREMYRADLDIGPDERLVVVTSTAGEHCLWKDWPDLLHRLVTELPRSRYRVIAILHPHLHYAFGGQLMHALQPSLRLGLRVVQPEQDWAVPLIAADWCLGDHGSVLQYATRTPAALLTAAFHRESVFPGTVRSELGDLVPALSRTKPIETQLLDAARSEVRERYGHLGELLSSESGEFAANLRRLVHEELAVPEPSFPARLPPLETPRF